MPVFEGKKNDARINLEKELKEIYNGYNDSTINTIIKLYKLVTKDRHPEFNNVKNWVDSVGGLTMMLLTFGDEYSESFDPKAVADIASKDAKLEKILRDRAIEYYDYDDFNVGDEVVSGVKFSEEPIEQLAVELIDLDDKEVLGDTLKDLSAQYNATDDIKECNEQITEDEEENDSEPNIDPEIEKAEEETLELNEINLNSLNELASKVHNDGTYVYGENKTLKKVDLEYGYQVSFFRPEITDAEINMCLSTIGDRLGNMYLGIWKGAPEISYCVDDMEKAKEIADCFNQEAIWDNAAEIAIANPRFDADEDSLDYGRACETFTHIAIESHEDDEVSDVEGVVTTDVYKESCKVDEDVTDENAIELSEYEKDFYINSFEDDDTINELNQLKEFNWFVTTDKEYDEYGELNDYYQYVLVINNRPYDVLSGLFVEDMLSQRGPEEETEEVEEVVEEPEQVEEVTEVEVEEESFTESNEEIIEEDVASFEDNEENS